MGQNQTLMFMVDNKPDVVCEVFTQALIHASEQAKTYLGFKDPEQKLRVSTRTLNEVFLMSFIEYCQEKGMQDRISTSRMTKQQEVLLGVDWIWTLTGNNRNTQFQIAVQTVQLGQVFRPTEMDEDPYERILERSITSMEDAGKTRYEKLLDFCSSIGLNCTGLVIVFGVLEKPKEIRGVLSKHLGHFKEKGAHITEEVLVQFLKSTDNFITVNEMIANYLCNGKKANTVERVYINFL
ncbi:rab15 effector protein-like [Ambystoma mexicanum]|uniref:rab15 effector protein-like n=1 Tax=Ambystoma mexicanum TaxID=8296 RepID=UPI0037E943F0